MKFSFVAILMLPLVGRMNLRASDLFVNAVTNALETKSRLVDSVFTNYICNCASQSTNEEMALTAKLVQTVISLELFEDTMDDACLRQAFQSATNTMNQASQAVGSWQYWHAQLLHAMCMNTDNNLSGAYFVASNAWCNNHSFRDDESTNVVSRSLLRYYGLDRNIPLREAVAAFTAIAADGVGNTNESNRLKMLLSDQLKQKVELFLTTEM